MFKGKRSLMAALVLASIVALFLGPLVVAQTFFQQVPGGGLIFDQHNPVIRYSGELSFQNLTGTTHIISPLTATATLDFSSAADNDCSTDLTVTVTGAAAGDRAEVAVPAASKNVGAVFFAWVSTADTIGVTHCAIGGASDPASGTYRVDVWRH